MIGAAANGRAADWEAYASSYDAVTWANPAYRALVDRVRRTLDGLALGSDATAADLGCGTGTFTQLLLERFGAGLVFALDRSPAFLARLNAKHGGHRALRLVPFDMDRDKFPRDLDVVVAIHVLCHAANPREVLGRLHAALRPGGTLIVADIGRPLIWSEWLGYMWRAVNEDYAARGWGPLSALPAAGFFYRHRHASRLNGELSRRQAVGEVWMHDLAAFVAALEAADFAVIEADDREYRGVDSFAVARRPGGADARA